MNLIRILKLVLPDMPLETSLVEYRNALRTCLLLAQLRKNRYRLRTAPTLRNLAIIAHA